MTFLAYMQNYVGRKHSMSPLTHKSLLGTKVEATLCCGDVEISLALTVEMVRVDVKMNRAK